MVNSTRRLAGSLIGGGLAVAAIALLFQVFIVGANTDLKSVEVAAYYSLVGFSVALLVGGALDWAVEKRFRDLGEKIDRILEKLEREEAKTDES